MTAADTLTRSVSEGERFTRHNSSPDDASALADASGSCRQDANSTLGVQPAERFSNGGRIVASAIPPASIARLIH